MNGSDHRTIIVHEGKTYIVTLKFEFREGKLAVSVISTKPTNILAHETNNHAPSMIAI